MKVFCIFLAIIGFSNMSIADDGLLEFGIGVEYGGIGTQVKFPISSKIYEPFISVGIFGSDSEAGEALGVGLGVNYFVSKKNALSFYGGVLNTERSLTNNFEVKSKNNHGLSVGYKYFINSKGKRGLSLGLTYNIYSGGSYPFFSIGYIY